MMNGIVRMNNRFQDFENAHLSPKNDMEGGNFINNSIFADDDSELDQNTEINILDMEDRVKSRANDSTRGTIYEEVDLLKH